MSHCSFILISNLSTLLSSLSCQWPHYSYGHLELEPQKYMSSFSLSYNPSSTVMHHIHGSSSYCVSWPHLVLSPFLDGSPCLGPRRFSISSPFLLLLKDFTCLWAHDFSFISFHFPHTNSRLFILTIIQHHARLLIFSK